ncbi:MAG: DNA-binding protein [Candidatus Accumulibacter sp.]|jgi:plasmid stabilization system protein ParE|nr:DNA-binding protein [Accumulibacter sp.]
MKTLVELPSFRKQAEAIWSESEYEAFTFWLAQNPEAGEVVPGTRGGRKLRWKRAGSGKSTGARVIYYHLVARGQILLVAIYTKADRGNLPAHEIAKLIE